MRAILEHIDVSLLVSQFVLDFAETDEPIEMTFGGRLECGPTNGTCTLAPPGE